MSEASLPVSLTRFYFPYSWFLVFYITSCNAALSFVEGESRSACFDAADVSNENAAELLTFRNEIP